MPAVAVCTVDQISTVHACDSTAGIQGTLITTVTIGGNPIAVQGDAIAPHTILVGDDCVPHGAVINAGSSKVFAGGIPVARIGDSADAGSVISGSSNVFAGG
jgi:uncharacterized Zn-binding protein involved in type VI secretion